MQLSTSSLIGTNRVPSETEREEIHHVLRDRKFRLTALEGANMFSGTLAISFHKIRDDFQSEISALLALLSPSRRLAPELVALIFEFCLPNRELRASEFRANEAPLLIAQICRGWRHVALSTPRLWTRMSICLPLGRLPQSAWITAIAQASFASLLWLSRSGNHKLHIYVQYDRSNESDGSQMWLLAATELISRLLHRHGSRIESFLVSLPVPCVSPLLRASCPSMRKLVVIDNGLWQPGDYHAQTQVGIYLAGRLRHLVLDTSAFDLRRTRYPWDQLTTLSLRQQFPITLPDCISLLSMCHRLHTFKVLIGATGIAPDEYFVVPTLRELWLYGGPNQSGPFLDAISIPDLKTLVIGDGYHQSSVLDFLQRLSRPLSSLHFHRIYNMSEGELLDVLKLVPSLVELNTASTCHNLILDMLTPEDNFEPLCPRLESLTMRLHLANEQLVELLDARSGTDFVDQGVVRLKKAHLTFMDADQRNETWEWDDVAWMRKVDQWRLKGMDMQVSDFDWNDSEAWDGAFAHVFGE